MVKVVTERVWKETLPLNHTGDKENDRKRFGNNDQRRSSVTNKTPQHKKFMMKTEQHYYTYSTKQKLESSSKAHIQKRKKKSKQESWGGTWSATFRPLHLKTLNRLKKHESRRENVTGKRDVRQRWKKREMEEIVCEMRIVSWKRLKEDDKP